MNGIDAKPDALRRKSARLFAAPLAASLLTCLGPVAGCDQAAEPASDSSTEAGSTDTRLDARVERELRQQPVLREVAVSVRSGVVTLSGRVPDLTDRDRAETLVRRIEGVRDVRNELSASGVIDTSPRVDPHPESS